MVELTVFAPRSGCDSVLVDVDATDCVGAVGELSRAVLAPTFQ